MSAIWTALKRWRWYILGGIAAFVAIFAISAAIDNYWQFADRAPDRGALLMAQDAFGDIQTHNACVADADHKDCYGQGWSAAESLWFANTTQGSDLMPYDFFMVLQQTNRNALFRDDANMNGRYRYLVRHPTSNNPDGLPAGIVKNSYNGLHYIGFTCAACHSGEIDYKGAVMRIDGAPAMSDMNNLLIDLSRAVEATRNDAAKKKQFVDAVLARGGDYRNPAQVDADLTKFSTELKAYAIINHVGVPYGFARLDAFGRIYNRLLEHLLSPQALRQALEKLVNEGKVTPEARDAVLKDASIAKAFTGSERAGILQRINADLKGRGMVELRDELLNKPDAPVSYPFLWDIPQHDFVQWNGIGSNGGPGPLGRNVGEVVGVFATLDWVETTTWSLSTYLTGQGFNTKAIDWQSSVNVANLRKLERQLKTLHAPQWRQTPLPRIDDALAAKGEPIFDRYCSACHANINPASPQRRIVAFLGKVEDCDPAKAPTGLCTDPKMANNSVDDMGYSGILRNQYSSTGVGDVLLNERSHVEPLLVTAVQNVIATPDKHKFWLVRWYEWIYNIVASLSENDIKSTIKNGTYTPDTTANPFASLKAYKGRALDGIWATAPYLHNGSVPTLYDLLLPKKLASDPVTGEYRPDTFLVGSREFDPVNVGYKSADYPVDPNPPPGAAATACQKAGQPVRIGYCFDTSKEGNHNTGHEYGARDETLPDGSVLKALTREERLELIEYLKTL